MQKVVIEVLYLFEIARSARNFGARAVVNKDRETTTTTKITNENKTNKSNESGRWSDGESLGSRIT